MEIRILRAGDGGVLNRVAPGVFDDPLDSQAVHEFLHDPRHHLIVALDGEMVVGFVSAVHYVHPDKPSPELWINEVGVAPTHQGRGIGKALLQRSLDLAHDLGCAEGWVLTDRSNDAAQRLYKSLGGEESSDEPVMFSFAVDKRS